MASLTARKSPLASLALVLALFPAALWAGSVGTTTADILKINQGTRPAGMGGVYTALGDDLYSVHYNPAGVLGIKASEAIALHLDSLADIQYEMLGFGTSWGGGNTLAANLTYRHSPPIDNQVPGENIAYTDDLLGSLTYARALGKNFRAGLTAKFLQSTLGPFSASAIGFDAGIQLDNLPFGLKAGLSVLNLGTGMTFNPDSQADSLPMFIRAGLGTHQTIDKDKDLNAAVEIFKPADQDMKLGVGAEFWVFPKLFAVRAGYKMEGLGAQTYNVFQNYSLGCTLTRDFDGDDFSVDIAYNPAEFIAPSDPTSTVEPTFFFALNFHFNQFRIF